MWEDKPCDRLIQPAPHGIDETPVCLMHTQNTLKNKQEFQEEFKHILAVAGDGVADFSRFVFPGADYLDREFKAKCIFRYARFTDDAYFQGAMFQKSVDFYAATFMEDASFYGVTFKEATDFRFATFTRRAIFYQATFTQGSDFHGATFTEAADFDSATFTQGVTFKWAKFLATAEFRQTKFRSDDTPEPGLIFSLVQCSHPEGVLFSKTHLGQALFHNCDVSKINFSSVTWRRRAGSNKRMVLEEDKGIDLSRLYFNALVPKQGNPDERDYGLVAELYQQLKKNYDDKCDYWTAGDFHYGEMEMKRLSSPKSSGFGAGCTAISVSPLGTNILAAMAKASSGPHSG